MSNWKERPVSISDNITVTAFELFCAGMDKHDFMDLLNSSPEEERTKLLNTRELTGMRFTNLNITTAYANKLLLIIGESHYSKGIREPWTLYAHKKTNRNRIGCLFYILIAIFIIYKIVS